MDINNNDAVVENLKNNDFHDIGPYAAIFNDTCRGWLDNPDWNMFYLIRVQNCFNCKLMLDGFVLLMDIYEYLGIKCNEMQSCVGWLYLENNPIGDNFIDLGIIKAQNIGSVNIVLNPNVDGCIGDDPDKLAEAICRANIRKFGL